MIGLKRWTSKLKFCDYVVAFRTSKLLLKLKIQIANKFLNRDISFFDGESIRFTASPTLS
jgi:hypothetical protein